jgi:hypothetical protein
MCAGGAATVVDGSEAGPDTLPGGGSSGAVADAAAAAGGGGGAAEGDDGDAPLAGDADGTDDGDAPLAGGADGTSVLCDLVACGAEDFEDLTAVGAFLLRQFATNVVVELPGAGEGVVFAPLHFALGASRRLWTSSLDAPFAETLPARDFVATALRSSVGVFAAKPYLDATAPLLPLFIIEVGKMRQAVGLVATDDGALIVRTPRSVPNKFRYQLRSPSNSICSRLNAAVFSPRAAGALGSAFAVHHAGIDVTVYLVQDLVVRDPSQRNLRALLRRGGAAFAAPPPMHPGGDEGGDEGGGVREGAAAAVAPAAALPKVRFAAPPPVLRLLSADFFFSARVGGVRDRAAPNMPLVLDVRGGDAQPVLLRLIVDDGVASWVHFTGAEALAQRTLGDAWTERGRWGSAATSHALLSDPVFDFPPGAVLVPLLDTVLYRLAPLAGADAAPNLAALEHGQSSAVLAYYATAPPRTNPLVLVRPSNRLNTAGAKAALGNFKNRKRLLQHAALVGHLVLSRRFNLLTPLAVSAGLAERLFFSRRFPVAQPPAAEAAALAQGQPALDISAQHRPAAPVFPPEFDDDTARSVSPFDVYLRLHAAAARAVSAALPLPPDVRDAAHRYLFTLLGGVVRLNPPRFALNTRDAHWFSRVDNARRALAQGGLLADVVEQFGSVGGAPIPNFASMAQGSVFDFGSGFGPHGALSYAFDPADYLRADLLVPRDSNIPLESLAALAGPRFAPSFTFPVRGTVNFSTFAVIEGGYGVHLREPGVGARTTIKYGLPSQTSFSLPGGGAYKVKMTACNGALSSHDARELAELALLRAVTALFHTPGAAPHAAVVSFSCATFGFSNDYSAAPQVELERLRACAAGLHDRFTSYPFNVPCLSDFFPALLLALRDVAAMLGVDPAVRLAVSLETYGSKLFNGAQTAHGDVAGAIDGLRDLMFGAPAAGGEVFWEPHALVGLLSRCRLLGAPLLLSASPGLTVSGSAPGVLVLAEPGEALRSTFPQWHVRSTAGVDCGLPVCLDARRAPAERAAEQFFSPPAEPPHPSALPPSLLRVMTYWKDAQATIHPDVARGGGVGSLLAGGAANAASLSRATSVLLTRGVDGAHAHMLASPNSLRVELTVAALIDGGHGAAQLAASVDASMRALLLPTAQTLAHSLGFVGAPLAPLIHGAAAAAIIRAHAPARLAATRGVPADFLQTSEQQVAVASMSLTGLFSGERLPRQLDLRATATSAARASGLAETICRLLGEPLAMHGAPADTGPLWGVLWGAPRAPEPAAMEGEDSDGGDAAGGFAAALPLLHFPPGAPETRLRTGLLPLTSLSELLRGPPLSSLASLAALGAAGLAADGEAAALHVKRVGERAFSTRSAQAAVRRGERATSLVARRRFASTLSARAGEAAGDGEEEAAATEAIEEEAGAITRELFRGRPRA